MALSRLWFGLVSLVAVAGMPAQEVPMGIVEGFYGPPWSHQDRLDVIEFMGDHDLDLYIYAPKDDPRHRATWRDPYTAEELAEFRELVEACQANGVEFCFAVSPGQDMVYSDAREQAILLDKMMALHADGVTHFALFLDDIDVDRMGEADRAQFATAAHAQMYLCNAMHRQIMEREPEAWFLMCPTLYCGVEPDPYWDTLRENLDEGIAVVWTGIDVVAPTITDAHLDAITAQLGRPPFIWDNYPVNDYIRSHLRLGPIDGRTPNLTERISGYASNPMNEAHASLIALATIADFLHDPEGYDPEESWRRAILEVGGDDAADLMVFAEQARASQLNNTESTALLAVIDAYLADPDEYHFYQVRDALDELIAVIGRLPDEIDPALAAELDRHLQALSERANAMRLALLFIQGLVTEGSTPTLVRLIDRVRTADVVIAERPSERLFEYAVGADPTRRGRRVPSHAIDAIDPPLEGEYGGSRGPDQLIVYTPGYGHPTTGTNQWGAEAIVEGGFVTEVGGNDSPIPSNGFVVSGHGESAGWIRLNMEENVPASFDAESVLLGAIPEDLITPDQRLRRMRTRTLGVLGELVVGGADHQTLGEARAVLREIDALRSSDEPLRHTPLLVLEPRLELLEAKADALAAGP